MCENCNKDLVCPICGKVCKNKRGFEVHYESCKEKNNSETTAEVQEEIIEGNWQQELINFFDGLGNRMTTSTYDLNRMVTWFRNIYPKSTLQFDFSCGSCVNHLINKCKDYYKKIK